MEQHCKICKRMLVDTPDVDTYRQISKAGAIVGLEAGGVVCQSCVPYKVRCARKENQGGPYGSRRAGYPIEDIGADFVALHEMDAEDLAKQLSGAREINYQVTKACAELTGATIQAAEMLSNGDVVLQLGDGQLFAITVPYLCERPLLVPVAANSLAFAREFADDNPATAEHVYREAGFLAEGERLCDLRPLPTD